MSEVEIHLMLNHVAIMAAIFSVVVFGAGFFRKNATMMNVALVGFVVAALFAIPVFNTGEGAEEAVEHLPGVVESVIEQHEEAAETAIWFVEILGVAALGGIIMRKRAFFQGNAFRTIIMALSIGAAGLIGYTGHLGGKIRHTESVSGGINASSEQGGGNDNGGAVNQGKDDDGDDD